MINEQLEKFLVEIVSHLKELAMVVQGHYDDSHPTYHQLEYLNRKLISLQKELTS